MSRRINKKFLNVGLACLDTVFYCSSYPEEDSDQRCISHEWTRGGNASNSSTVMAEFEVPCEYFGTLSSDMGGMFLKQHMEDHGIAVDHCIIHKSSSCPTSVVLINSQNGSRTIVHSNKNLPEVTFDDFKTLDLQKYKWIHFEVRPEHEIKKMIKHIRDWNGTEGHDKIIVSIELEKPKPENVELIEYGDVVFISKDFAMASGFSCKKSAVEALSVHLKTGSLLVCPWSEDGACAKVEGGETIMVPSYPPQKLVDTLGAGDVFIAVTIMCLANEWNVKQAVHHACQVAGAKCGIEGFRGLQTLCSSFFI